MGSDNIREVDGLRAVAVLAVLLFHAGIAGFSGGFVGVDIFFTISGFVITRSILSDLERDRFTLTGFYVRRVRRLIPALLFTIALTLIVATLIMPPDLLRDAGQSAMYAIVPVSNIFFWASADYFDLDANLKPLLHTWSLSVEEQFYFIWPIVLVTLAMRRILLVALISVASIASLVAAQYMLGIDLSAAFYLTPFRLFEFGLGCICALYFDQGRQRLLGFFREAVFLVGVALMLAPVFIYDNQTPFPGLSALYPTLGTALVIMACGASLSKLLLGASATVAIGRASYSIYLLHWPIISLYGIYTAADFTHAEQLTIVVVSIAAGFAMARLIERPFRAKGGHADERKHIPFMFGVTGAAMVLVVASANAWVHGVSASQTGDDSNNLDQLGFVEMIEHLCNEAEPKLLAGYNCRLGPRKSQLDVLVFGDSHTGHLIPGLAAFAEDEGLAIRVDGTGGTFPGRFAESYRGTELQASKTRLKEQYYTWLAEIEPTVVVLAARWAIYFDATRTPDKEDAPLMYLVAEAGGELSSDVTTRTFRQSMQATVGYLTQLGHKVVLVGQIPPLGKTPHLCLRKNGIVGDTQDDSQCRDFTMEQALERVARPNGYLANLADSESVFFVDPSSYFCTAGEMYCRIFAGQNMLYRDSNHLTPAASRLWMKEQIGRAITPAVAGGVARSARS